ncbi:MAG: DUF4271 domain-containing protein, partial [Muribaculaceae bacterium]|nr:DUF4271 domain-containing protein [Muribaculaceae bacterium]
MMQDSISTYNKSWQTVDEIVVPAGNQESLVPYGMPTGSTSQPATVYKGWNVAQDSVVKAREDSITRAVNDSLAHIRNGYGLVIESPYTRPLEHVIPITHGQGSGLSWIFAILGLLFCVICMKLKNTPGYLVTLWTDMREVRIRHNVFDNTVKETSFLILLIVCWICCVGILLWQVLQSFGGMPFVSSPQFIPNHTLTGVGLCSAVAGIYVVFMLIAYEITGNVFSDRIMTRMRV